MKREIAMVTKFPQVMAVERKRGTIRPASRNVNQRLRTLAGRRAGPRGVRVVEQCGRFFLELRDGSQVLLTED
jgi:hypothetical protein|tara:strand:+ start:201 stop:419 length:219 start_codon:yes stop_codon:yes gene_type:complete